MRAKRRLRTHTHKRTNQLIDWIGPEGRISENGLNIAQLPTRSHGKGKILAAKSIHKTEIGPLTKCIVLKKLTSTCFIEKFDEVFFSFKRVLIYHSWCPKNGFKFVGRDLPIRRNARSFRLIATCWELWLFILREYQLIFCQFWMFIETLPPCKNLKMATPPRSSHLLKEIRNLPTSLPHPSSVFTNTFSI